MFDVLIKIDEHTEFDGYFNTRQLQDLLTEFGVSEKQFFGMIVSLHLEHYIKRNVGTAVDGFQYLIDKLDEELIEAANGSDECIHVDGSSRNELISAGIVATMLDIITLGPHMIFDRMKAIEKIAGDETFLVATMKIIRQMVRYNKVINLSFQITSVVNLILFDDLWRLRVEDDHMRKLVITDHCGFKARLLEPESMFDGESLLNLLLFADGVCDLFGRYALLNSERGLHI
jgi:hypothetical protein